MTVIQQPSIWDYIASGLQGGVENFQVGRRDRLDRAQRANEFDTNRDMNLMQLFSQMAANGSMRAADVNRSDAGRRFGVNMAPAPAELARNITESPTGAPEIFGMLPGMAPGMGPVPMVRTKPWTDDQRRLARMPTSDAIAVERLSGAQARTGLAVQQFDQFKPVFEAAATRGVAGALGQLGQPITPRNMGMVAKTAYENWLKEQAEQGELGIVDPAQQKHARAFFDQAALAALEQQKQNDLLSARAFNYTSGGGGDENIRLLGQLRQGVDNLNRQNERIMEPWKVFFTIPSKEAQDVFLASNPSFKPVYDEFVRNQGVINGYQQGIAHLTAGRIPPNIQQLISAIPTTTTEIAPPAGPASTVAPRSQEQLARAVRSLREAKRGDAATAQTLFSQMWPRLTPQDRQYIATQTGLTP